MAVYILLVVLAVLFFKFRSSKKVAEQNANAKKAQQAQNASAKNSIFNEAPQNQRRVDTVLNGQTETSTSDVNKVFENSSMQERAETHVAENSLLGGVLSPSPIELEKQIDFARPIMQPLENSTSLFEADKVDDLTRPWGQQLASEPTNLFEIDKKHDLTKPWGEN